MISVCRSMGKETQLLSVLPGLVYDESTKEIHLGETCSTDITGDSLVLSSSTVKTQ